MKKVVLALISIFIGLGLNAQEAKVVKESFYESGAVKSQFVEVNKSLIQATYFYETGEIYETGFFENEQLSGKWKTYASNSEILAIGYFKENKKTGTWSFFKEGELHQEISYSSTQMAKK